MFDPRDPYRGTGPGFGLAGMFVPQNTVGCLAGLFVLTLIAIGAGVVSGLGLAAAVVVLVLLVPLTVRALRGELRRDNLGQAQSSQASLPSDAELTDEERRHAMRRHGRKQRRDE